MTANLKIYFACGSHFAPPARRVGLVDARIDVDAAQLITIMFTAGSLLLATFLAARVIGFACQVLASDLTVHVTATAFDISI